MKILVASNYDKPVGIIDLRIDMCLVWDFVVLYFYVIVPNQTNFHWRYEQLEQCILLEYRLYPMTIVIIYLRRSSILSILASVLKPLGSKLVLEAL
jgi:hypothetical protein